MNCSWRKQHKLNRFNPQEWLAILEDIAVTVSHELTSGMHDRKWGSTSVTYCFKINVCKNAINKYHSITPDKITIIYGTSARIAMGGVLLVSWYFKNKWSWRQKQTLVSLVIAFFTGQGIQLSTPSTTPYRKKRRLNSPFQRDRKAGQHRVCFCT